jgi:hypothetical protein
MVFRFCAFIVLEEARNDCVDQDTTTDGNICHRTKYSRKSVACQTGVGFALGDAV